MQLSNTAFSVSVLCYGQQPGVTSLPPDCDSCQEAGRCLLLKKTNVETWPLQQSSKRVCSLFLNWGHSLNLIFVLLLTQTPRDNADGHLSSWNKWCSLFHHDLQSYICWPLSVFYCQWSPISEGSVNFFVPCWWEITILEVTEWVSKFHPNVTFEKDR